MTELPGPVHEWLARRVAGERHAAFVQVDADGRVVAAGGEVERYGLADLEAGAPIAERCEWLLGMLPPPGGAVHLPRVALAASLHFDADLFDAAGSTWLVILDASREVWHQQMAQHATHALALLHRREEAAEAVWSLELLHGLELAVFSPAPGGGHRVRAPAPAWLRHAWPEELAAGEWRSPALAGFMAEAEAHWRRGEVGPLSSGAWDETGVDGRARRLEATALRLGHGGEAIVVRVLAPPRAR